MVVLVGEFLDTPDPVYEGGTPLSPPGRDLEREADEHDGELEELTRELVEKLKEKIGAPA